MTFFQDLVRGPSWAPDRSSFKLFSLSSAELGVELRKWLQVIMQAAVACGLQRTSIIVLTLHIYFSQPWLLLLCTAGEQTRLAQSVSASHAEGYYDGLYEEQVRVALIDTGRHRGCPVCVSPQIKGDSSTLLYFSLSSPLILFFTLSFNLQQFTVSSFFPSLLCPPLPSSSQTPILSHLSGANGRIDEVGDKLTTSSGLTCVRVKSSALRALHRLLWGMAHTCNSAHTRHTTGRNKYKQQNTYTPSYFYTHARPLRRAEIPARLSLIGHLSNARLHLAPVEHSLTFQAADLSSPTTTK